MEKCPSTLEIELGEIMEALFGVWLTLQVLLVLAFFGIATLAILPLIVFFQGLVSKPTFLIADVSTPDKLSLFFRTPNERVITVVDNSNVLKRMFLRSDTLEFIGGEFPVDMSGYSEIIECGEPRVFHRNRARYNDLVVKRAKEPLTAVEAHELATLEIPKGMHWSQTFFGVYDKYVQKVTGGLRFVGIPGLRRVRFDKNFVKVNRYKTVGGKTQEVWEVEASTTDHVRSSNFSWYLTRDQVEVAGGVPFNIKFSIVAACEYPIDTLFTSDKWYAQFSDAAQRASRETMKGLQVEDLLARTIEDDGTVKIVSNAEAQEKFEAGMLTGMSKIGRDLMKNTFSKVAEEDGKPVIYGIKVLSVQLIDADPSNDAVRADIQKRFSAVQEGDAYRMKRTRVAAGDRKYLEEIAAGARSHEGTLALQLEALKVAGEKGNTIIISGGDDSLGKALFSRVEKIARVENPKARPKDVK